jgi:hypothetical protein
MIKSREANAHVFFGNHYARDATGVSQRTAAQLMIAAGIHQSEGASSGAWP